MRRGAGRARRILALAASSALASLTLTALPSATSSIGAAPAEHCPADVPLCHELSTTTTTIGEDTTTTPTSFETTTTEATTTTRRAATTTAAEVTSTTVATSTSDDVLVPGDGTEGAELTTTTEVTATRISSGGPSDGTLIALVVLGLVVIAAVVAVLTWRYWVATRPPLLDEQAHPHDAG